MNGADRDRYRLPVGPPTVFESWTANYIALITTVLVTLAWLVWLANR